jgi:hypothetical protein
VTVSEATGAFELLATSTSSPCIFCTPVSHAQLGTAHQCSTVSQLQLGKACMMLLFTKAAYATHMASAQIMHGCLWARLNAVAWMPLT